MRDGQRERERERGKKDTEKTTKELEELGAVSLKSRTHCVVSPSSNHGKVAQISQIARLSQAGGISRGQSATATATARSAFRWHPSSYALARGWCISNTSAAPTFPPQRNTHANQVAQQEGDDDYDDDDDSALGSDAGSSTASITSTILQYREINGRRFHSEMGSVQYW